jgi:hypothetical protein
MVLIDGTTLMVLGFVVLLIGVGWLLASPPGGDEASLENGIARRIEEGADEPGTE